MAQERRRGQEARRRGQEARRSAEARRGAEAISAGGVAASHAGTSRVLLTFGGPASDRRPARKQPKGSPCRGLPSPVGFRRPRAGRGAAEDFRRRRGSLTLGRLGAERPSPAQPPIGTGLACVV